MAKYDEKGQEIPDPRPMAIPIGMKRPETLQEMIARMVHQHSVVAQRHGHETFEEADDFDVEDEDVPVSPYQMTQMQEETPRVRRKVVSIEKGKPEGKAPAKPEEPAAAAKQ